MWFTFDFAVDYLSAHRRFKDMQGSHDPSHLVIFLAEQPNHTEAMLQLALVCAHTANLDRGAEFVRRCLYTYECAIVEQAALLAGNARFDYDEEANRPFFLALFHHMRMCGAQGCERTALELATLLLSLDPEGARIILSFLSPFFNFDFPVSFWATPFSRAVSHLGGSC